MTADGESQVSLAMDTKAKHFTAFRRLQEAVVPPQLERGISDFAVRSLFEGARRLGLADGVVDASADDIEVVRDVAYGSQGAQHHLLDVYRPAHARGGPALLYIHGGGFRILSKDTHEILARLFAHRGYTVFNINYRLAPEHPFPTGLQDAARAYRWVVERGADFGADVDQLVLSGESSGANFALALAVMSTYRRAEPWARSIFDLGVVPSAVVPTCGFLQVSDPMRFARRKPLPGFVRDRLVEAAQAYLPQTWLEAPSGSSLADPLCILERQAPERELPPVFAAVGTRDPLLDDTRRLQAAVQAHGARCDTRYFPGELHSFHAFVWRDNARTYWQQVFAFLESALRTAPLLAAE